MLTVIVSSVELSVTEKPKENFLNSKVVSGELARAISMEYNVLKPK
jgi:hypothetical protein